MEFNNTVGPEKSWKIKVRSGRLLLQMSKQGQSK